MGPIGDDLSLDELACAMLLLVLVEIATADIDVDVVIARNQRMGRNGVNLTLRKSSAEPAEKAPRRSSASRW